MALTDEEIEKLTKFATENLNVADQRWDVASEHIEKASFKESVGFLDKSISTPFPGVASVAEARPEVRDYFVLMADMRDSTAHLRSVPPADALVVSGLHRLYLETSGLLPTLAYHIRNQKGRVTEYLGDGVLAFVQARDLSSSRAYGAAVTLGEDCLQVCNDVVNRLLSTRYGLPQIKIGVGISVGQAIITIMGSGDDARAIAFGTPVFESSKVSKANDDVIISETMRKSWPKSPSGKRKFQAVSVRGSAVGYKTWIP